MFGYLTREEMLAVIGEPRDSWLSQHDHALLLLTYNTGACMSEIIWVKVGDVVFDTSAACIHLHGKARNLRSVPLWQPTVKELRAWLHVYPQFETTSPLLRNRDEKAMTRFNVANWLSLVVRAAAAQYPRLSQQRVSPHIRRSPCP